PDRRALSETADHTGTDILAGNSWEVALGQRKQKRQPRRSEAARSSNRSGLGCVCWAYWPFIQAMAFIVEGCELLTRRASTSTMPLSLLPCPSRPSQLRRYSTLW